MGNVQANLTKQTLAAYTNVINSTVANVFNNAAQTCAGGNYFSLSTGQGCPFEIVNGEFNLTQRASTTCTLNSQNITSLSAQFKTDLINNTRQFIEQESKNSQGWFATALSLQINQASTVEEIVNQINNSFNVNFTNTCSSVSTAFNTAVLNLCGYFDATKFNISQNAIVDALTSCVNENTINIWTSNSVLNKLWQDTDSKLASHQGFDPKWLIIGVVAIILLIVILIIVLVIIGRKKQPAIET